MNVESDEEVQAALKPPQFGLRLIFWLVAFAAIAIAAFRVLDPAFAFAMLVIGLAVFAHVAGNALGTQLRKVGDTPRRRSEAAPQKAEAHHFAPQSDLSRRQKLGWVTLILTGLGAVTGAIGGGFLLAIWNWQKATVSNITLATASCGVLGALLGFWLASFLQVFGSAILEAHRNADPDPHIRRR